MYRFSLYPGADTRFSTSFPRPHTKIFGVGARPGQWRLVVTRHFFMAWLALSTLLVVFLYAVGLVPRGVSELGDKVVAFLTGESAVPDASLSLSPAGAAFSNARIIIPGIGLSGPVVFPKSATLDVLNAALLDGAVHYPGSALPGEEGTVFLFGHSTGLTVVHNKNFEIFNHLSGLENGDTIRLRYGSREYWYRVRSVELKRTDAAVVELAPQGERLLVLLTCNVFGGVDDRFIVTAEFTGSYPLQGGVGGTAS